MNGYVDNIEEKTVGNESFRKVLFTGKHMQLVVMTLKPGEDIGEEVHPNVDQFFRIEEGSAKVVIDGEEHMLEMDMVAIVPAGSTHNVINASMDVPVKLYTIYTPPNHPEGTEHVTKEDAMMAEEEHHAQESNMGISSEEENMDWEKDSGSDEDKEEDDDDEKEED